MFNKIAKFASTPQGRRMIGQVSTRAQRAAKDPATRAKAQRLLSQLGKGRGSGTPPAR